MNSQYNPLRPYDALPALPPPFELESRAVLKACIGARAALAALNEATALLPNPDVLLSALVLLEAKASSEVENIITTADRLFQFADHGDAGADSATKETLRYRAALYQGLELLKTRPLSTTLAEIVCTRTKGVDMQVRRVPGTALVNDRTGEVIYTPPQGEALLREKLANWERFCHAQPGDAQHAGELDPLVRMAAQHYQFEAIHPFTDGNGRTGRILNLLLLVEQGLLGQPVLFLSRYILQNRTQYYASLLAVTTQGDALAWEAWLLYMLEAVRETAQWTHAKVQAIQQLMRITESYIRGHNDSVYSHELLLTIFRRPYSRITDLTDTGLVKRQTASTHLKALVWLGVLKEIQVGREKLFVHPRLIELLASESHEVKDYPPVR
jgi:Fic family protein